MSKLKEETIKVIGSELVKIPALKSEDLTKILSILSSKIDEIEKEVMGLLPEERKPSEFITKAPQSLGIMTENGFEETIKKGQELKQTFELDDNDVGYNSAIKTIREKLTKYFL